MVAPYRRWRDRSRRIPHDHQYGEWDGAVDQGYVARETLFANRRLAAAAFHRFQLSYRGQSRVARLDQIRRVSMSLASVRLARVEAHSSARRIERSWAHSSIGLGTNIAARNIPFNRQTLIPIRVDDFDVSWGEHRGTPRCSGSRCLLIVFSVLSSANTCSSKRAATRLLPNDESGCSDPERLVC